METHGRHYVLKVLVVGIAGNAVIGRGTVELGIKQRLTLAVVERAGEHEIHPAVLPAIAGASGESSIAGRREGEFESLQLWTSSGNDVDYGKEGVGTVERGARPADDFHPLDQIHVNQKLATQVRLAEKRYR